MKYLFNRMFVGVLASAIWLPAGAQRAAPVSPSTDSSPPLSALAQSFSERRPAFTQRGGENLYQAVCQGCHMAQGQGAKGAGFYPPLASNPKLAASAYAVVVVMNGLHGMPGFANRLTNEQVAEVVNYVRTNFNNSYTDAVTTDGVKAFR